MENFSPLLSKSRVQEQDVSFSSDFLKTLWNYLILSSVSEEDLIHFYPD